MLIVFAPAIAVDAGVFIATVVERGGRTAVVATAAAMPAGVALSTPCPPLLPLPRYQQAAAAATAATLPTVVLPPMMPCCPPPLSSLQPRRRAVAARRWRQRHATITPCCHCCCGAVATTAAVLSPPPRYPHRPAAVLPAAKTLSGIGDGGHLQVVVCELML